jgi:glycosylphosphatidylinositol transamidase (GPIT) subunit GPI8
VPDYFVEKNPAGRLLRHTLQVLVCCNNTLSIPTTPAALFQWRTRLTRPFETGNNMTNDPTNNHAVIVSSSRYWFNYRHVNNALVFYQLCKANGIPDENIILMLADDLPSNARNPFKNGMYASGPDDSKTLYDASIEIDYRGEDVNVENLARVLLGRQGDPATLAHGQGGHLQKRPHLKTDENSNILIVLTGHGGKQAKEKQCCLLWACQQ